MLGWNLRGNTVEIMTDCLGYWESWCEFCFGVLCYFSLGKWHGQCTDCHLSVVVEKWSGRQLSKLENANVEALDQQLGFRKDWNCAAWLLRMGTVFDAAEIMAVEISWTITASAKKGGIILAGQITERIYELIIGQLALVLHGRSTQRLIGGWNVVPDGPVEVLKDKLLQVGEHGVKRCLHVLFLLMIDKPFYYI